MNAKMKKVGRCAALFGRSVAHVVTTGVLCAVGGAATGIVAVGIAAYGIAKSRDAAFTAREQARGALDADGTLTAAGA